MAIFTVYNNTINVVHALHGCSDIRAFNHFLPDHLQKRHLLLRCLSLANKNLDHPCIRQLVLNSSVSLFDLQDKEPVTVIHALCVQFSGYGPLDVRSQCLGQHAH